MAFLKDAVLPAALLVMLAVLMLTGCTATKSVTYKFDKDGKVTEKIESSESVVKNITDSTRDKTVIAWESGWAAYISVSTATQEDPTPTCKMFAGKTDKGVVSLHKDQTALDKVPEIINATKYDLTVSTEGIGSQSASAEKGSAIEK